MNMDPSLLKILLLLSFWSPTEEEKPTATQQHYQRKNSSFCLQAAESPPYALSLTFGQNSVIYSNITSQAYQHRVDYNQTTKKWCLHQLSETDSGTYHFNVYKNDKVNMSNHKLLVEEAVPRPVIQVSALRSNLSAEPCTITVNCSVWESWVSSVCNESVCQTSDRSLKTVNITVLAGNRSVICIGRNYVSTSNISEAICVIHRHETSEELSYVLLLLLLAILSLLCAAILCIGTPGVFRRSSQRKCQELLRSPAESPTRPTSPRSPTRTSVRQRADRIAGWAPSTSRWTDPKRLRAAQGLRKPRIMETLKLCTACCKKFETPAS
ncbi:unnamed protein product [Tetraodon nigroviridis]|uniref:Chromosome undetermined SCAF14531, whole genome shotgun sequence n=1 Tax=Tetraodon nigroviridis TaxID=99883 RepID=Q4SQP9_TETNG|nr:unnamed protein product [Tetraodon nigroviridis]